MDQVSMSPLLSEPSTAKKIPATMKTR